MEEILWEYSWINLTMLMVSIPSFKKSDKNEDKETGQEVTNSSEFEGLMR